MADFVYDCCKAEIVGFLGNDPEVRTTQGGTTFVTFSVATKKKNRQGDYDTTWRNIVTFVDAHKDYIVAHVKKGSRVRVIADVEQRMWDKDGITVERTQFNIPPFDGYGVEVLPYEKKGNTQAPNTKSAPKPKSAPKSDPFSFYDSVPF